MSRMDKYFDASEEEMDSNTGEIKIVSSRLQKNQELYKQVSNLDIDDFDLNSNVSILGDNTGNIDLNEIQEKLSKKYREDRKDKGLGIGDDTPLPKINLDETREYDINSILAKAKEEKEVDYEEDRLKKLRNTQYDILKNLDLDKKEENDYSDVVEANKEDDEKKLKELIDTITAKELIKEEENATIEGEMDPLDLLSDLKGDDENTRVMGAINLDEDYPDESETSISLDELLKNKEIQDEINKEEEEKSEEEVEETSDEEEKEEVTEEIETTQEIPSDEDNTETQEIVKTDTSFFTNSTQLSRSDFEEFEDLKNDMKISKIIIRLLVFLLVIAFIIGVVLLLNNYLDLGLFNK